MSVFISTDTTIGKSWLADTSSRLAENRQGRERRQGAACRGREGGLPKSARHSLPTALRRLAELDKTAENGGNNNSSISSI